MQQYDIAIIGLGPAGCFLAKHLDSRFRVMALDKKTAVDSPFHKPCGGLLAPDAQKALSRFDLTLPVNLLVDPQIFSVHTIDIKTGLTRHYQRHYINLDRHRFDLWLRASLPAHIELEEDAVCRQVSPVPGGYEITYRKGGADHTVHARYVVGADGAGSVVRRALYPRDKIRTYLSIQEWFEDTHTTPFYSCVFDPDTTDCYAWGLTKDRHFIFGGAFAVHGARANYEALKLKLKGHGFHLDNPVKMEACLTHRPTGPNSFRCGRDGAFLVGEAAGFISPSSLEGISYAIDSGYRLSQCLNRTLVQPTADPHKLYRRSTRKIRLKLVGKNLKSPFMYQPFLRKLVMGSGLDSIPVLVEDKGAPI